MPLITVDEANAHLRLDLETDEGSPPAFIDPLLPALQSAILQVEGVICNYLKVDNAALIDGDADASPPVAPLWTGRDFYNVQCAAILLLKAIWDDENGRTAEDYMRMNTGTVPLLLARLRDPTLA